VGGALLLADVGVAQDVQAFRIGGHDPVFDPVVDHFDEVACAVGSAMEIAVLGGAGGSLLAARRARRRLERRRERGKDRIEVLYDFRLAADHLAEAAVQSPYAAAGTGIDVMDSLRLERPGAPDIIDVVGVAAVDDNVAGFEP